MKFPEGWKLVPLEPTTEMVEAAFDAIPASLLDGKIRTHYRAMLAAAHAGLAGWRQWAAWESGERRPPAATWELWLLRMRMHPEFELLPRRGYSPASGPAQARTT